MTGHFLYENVPTFKLYTAKCKINFFKITADVTTNLSTKNYIPVY